MRYLDTSLLVAAFTDELETQRALTWLGRQEVGQLTISDWVMTEFSAALSVKTRTGSIAERDRVAALAEFTRTVAASFEVASVTTQHFRAAARFADRHRLGLRAGDALHLAVAAELGATIFTLDKRLATAGTALGVKAKLF